MGARGIARPGMGEAAEKGNDASAREFIEHSPGPVAAVSRFENKRKATGLMLRYIRHNLKSGINFAKK